MKYILPVSRLYMCRSHVYKVPSPYIDQYSTAINREREDRHTGWRSSGNGFGGECARHKNILDQERRNRARRPADLPTHIHFWWCLPSVKLLLLRAQLCWPRIMIHVMYIGTMKAEQQHSPYIGFTYIYISIKEKKLPSDRCTGTYMSYFHRLIGTRVYPMNLSIFSSKLIGTGPPPASSNIACSRSRV